MEQSGDWQLLNEEEERGASQEESNEENNGEENGEENKMNDKHWVRMLCVILGTLQILVNVFDVIIFGILVGVEHGVIAEPEIWDIELVSEILETATHVMALVPLVYLFRCIRHPYWKMSSESMFFTINFLCLIVTAVNRLYVQVKLEQGGTTACPEGRAAAVVWAVNICAMASNGVQYYLVVSSPEWNFGAEEASPILWKGCAVLLIMDNLTSGTRDFIEHATDGYEVLDCFYGQFAVAILKGLVFPLVINWRIDSVIYFVKQLIHKGHKHSEPTSHKPMTTYWYHNVVYFLLLGLMVAIMVALGFLALVGGIPSTPYDYIRAIVQGFVGVLWLLMLMRPQGFGSGLHRAWHFDLSLWSNDPYESLRYISHNTDIFPLFLGWGALLVADVSTFILRSDPLVLVGSALSMASNTLQFVGLVSLVKFRKKSIPKRIEDISVATGRRLMVFLMIYNLVWYGINLVISYSETVFLYYYPSHVLMKVLVPLILLFRYHSVSAIYEQFQGHEEINSKK